MTQEQLDRMATVARERYEEILDGYMNEGDALFDAVCESIDQVIDFDLDDDEFDEVTDKVFDLLSDVEVSS